MLTDEMIDEENERAGCLEYAWIELQHRYKRAHTGNDKNGEESLRCTLWELMVGSHIGRIG